MDQPGTVLAILIPSFNDWDALRLLLPELDRAARGVQRRVSVLVVDDASTDATRKRWPNQEFHTLRSVDVLHLGSNHGPKIWLPCGRSLLPARAETSSSPHEPGAWRAWPSGRRWTHRAMTGVVVRVGNFRVIPRPALGRLMAVPDLWNHYAASVFRARLPMRLKPLPRGRRLAGKTKMSLVRWFTDLAIPGWATFTIGLLLILVVKLLTFATLFAFLIVSRRSAVKLMLTRDAPCFILGKSPVCYASGSRTATLSSERSWAK